MFDSSTTYTSRVLCVRDEDRGTPKKKSRGLHSEQILFSRTWLLVPMVPKLPLGKETAGDCCYRLRQFYHRLAVSAVVQRLGRTDETRYTGVASARSSSRLFFSLTFVLVDDARLEAGQDIEGPAQCPDSTQRNVVHCLLRLLVAHLDGKEMFEKHLNWY